MNNQLVAEMFGNLGYDAVVIDTQHGLGSKSDLLSNLQAIGATPAIPIVRPRWNTPTEIMTALDFGALGIICPMINTADDARQLVENCRYSPQGNRSFGPIRAATAYGHETNRYTANEAIIVMAMVESKQAYENLDDILTVEGLDGIYVGPSDLSLDMGYDPIICDADHDEYDAIIGDIAKRINATGRLAGTFCMDARGAKKRESQGYRFFNIGFDAGFIEGSVRRELDAYKGKS